MELQFFLARQLAKMNTLFQAGIDPEELLGMAQDWTRAFETVEDSPDIIAEAFVLHSRQSRHFPRPADILDLLPQCRRAPQQAAIPERVGPGQRIPPPHVAKARAEFIRDVAAGLYHGRRDEQEARARELGLIPPEDAESFMEACGW